ncbi:MAG: hypothetical protein A3E78_01920 [Alphaproteobacteria bacterium RIFCSPHIGHO2_12_FULL_63_12]|nr:MAG: hypothetical protein A3E78_01920 [Alphaproteobacteria bacterium RIFCSPHIGHO2_12_FULL_63_12]
MPDPLSLVTGGLFSAQGLSLVTGGLFSVVIDPNLHPRTRIRQYVVAKLKAAATTAADRVHAERVEPIQARTDEWRLPALNVFTRDEKVEIFSESPRVLKHTLDLVIDIIDGGKGVEDRIDQIEEEILKRIILPDRYLGQLAEDLVLASFGSDFDGAGAQKFGVNRLQFAVVYGREVSVQVGDDLLTVHNEWNFTAPDAQAEAEDVIEFEEA